MMPNSVITLIRMITQIQTHDLLSLIGFNKKYQVDLQDISNNKVVPHAWLLP